MIYLVDFNTKFLRIANIKEASFGELRLCLERLSKKQILSDFSRQHARTQGQLFSARFDTRVWKTMEGGGEGEGVEMRL